MGLASLTTILTEMWAAEMQIFISLIQLSTLKGERLSWRDSSFALSEHQKTLQCCMLSSTPLYSRIPSKLTFSKLLHSISPLYSDFHNSPHTQSPDCYILKTRSRTVRFCYLTWINFPPGKNGSLSSDMDTPARILIRIPLPDRTTSFQHSHTPYIWKLTEGSKTTAC